jgi:hypothetical protein
VLGPKSTLAEAFRDARGRLDGVLTLFFMALGIIVPIISFCYRYIVRDQASFNWLAPFASVIIFLFYLRYRGQSYPDWRGFEIIDLIFLNVASIALIYVLNFMMGEF